MCTYKKTSYELKLKWFSFCTCLTFLCFKRLLISKTCLHLLQMNDGPLCRCSLKAQRSGIRHGFYLGEKNLETCDPWSNNADRLYHYRVTISPPTNFLVCN